MDLYIYYRALTCNMAALHQQVLTMQAQLTQQTQVVAELKRRAQAEHGRHTWMEVYRDVPADFTARLNACAAACELERLIDGARHTEQFLDCASCA